MASELRWPRFVLFLAGLAAVVCTTVGCGTLLNSSAPGDPVGFWSSDDGESYIQINSNHTGVFTLCHPDREDGGLRYEYSADKWPSSIQITWQSSKSNSDNRENLVILSQDWEKHQNTGVGFGTVDRILQWQNGNLEMGVDLVVVYTKVAPDSLSCQK